MRVMVVVGNSAAHGWQAQAGQRRRPPAHLQRLAAGAAGALAQRLLAALVAGEAVDLVVHAVAGGVVAVLKQGPAAAMQKQSAHAVSGTVVGAGSGTSGGGGGVLVVRTAAPAAGCAAEKQPYWGLQAGAQGCCRPSPAPAPAHSPLLLVVSQGIQVLDIVNLLRHILCRQKAGRREQATWSVA